MDRKKIESKTLKIDFHDTAKQFSPLLEPCYNSPNFILQMHIFANA